MVLGELGFKIELFGQLIPVALQDRLDLFQADQTGLVGDPASGFESLTRIGPTEIEQTETDPVGLLGMGFSCQLRVYPGQRVIVKSGRAGKKSSKRLNGG